MYIEILINQHMRNLRLNYLFCNLDLGLIEK